MPRAFARLALIIVLSAGPGAWALSFHATCADDSAQFFGGHHDLARDFEGLSANEKRQVNEDAFLHNLFLSRTAQSGVSSKSFELSPEEAQRVARSNAMRAFESLQRAAENKNLSEQQIYELLVNLNRTFNEGIESTTLTGTKGLGGEFRRYTLWKESNNGITPADLPKRIESELRGYAKTLHDAFSDPKTDPIKLASWAHNTFVDEIKPFHDANGRTGRAVVDLVLLRYQMPLPSYVGELAVKENQQMAGSYVDAITGSASAFEKYLKQSVERTLEKAKATHGVDIDFASQSGFLSSMRHSGFDPDQIKFVRLSNGERVHLGRRLGAGKSATVYCLDQSCRRVLKVPRNEGAVLGFQEEIERSKLLRKLGIDNAVILNAHEAQPRYLIKEFVAGDLAKDVVQRNTLSDEQIHDLARLYTVSREHHLPLDADPANLVWDRALKRFVFVDTGMYEEYRTWYLSLEGWKYYYFKDRPEQWERFVSALPEEFRHEPAPNSPGSGAREAQPRH